MEIIDADKPDRTHIVWRFLSNGGGTNKFAVWEIGSVLFTLFQQDGIWLEKVEWNPQRGPIHWNTAQIVVERWCDIYGPLASQQWKGGEVYK